METVKKYYGIIAPYLALIGLFYIGKAIYQKIKS